MGDRSNRATQEQIFQLFPCLLFFGFVTFERAIQAAIENRIHSRGINRIRHYYVELALPRTAGTRRRNISSSKAAGDALPRGLQVIEEG